MTTGFDDLRSQLRAAVAVPEAARRRPRRVLGLRLPILAALAVAGLGSVATAATTLLLPSGDPVPAGEHAGPSKNAEDGGMILVRAPDPDGGPAWGLAVTRSKAGRGQIYPGTLTCVNAARTQAGRLGVVGVAGAFQNDGQFHALQSISSQSGACTASGPDGSFLLGSSPRLVAASGFSGAPDLRAEGRRISGCGLPQERLEAGQQRCSADVLRRVKYGFAGPHATNIEWGNGAARFSAQTSRQRSGGFLFVYSPTEGAGGGPWRLTTTYDDGSICREPEAAVRAAEVLKRGPRGCGLNQMQP